jgi:cardiolipin synthase
MPRTKKNRAQSSWKTPLLELWAKYNCWELGLISVGVLSFIGIVVILFMPIGKGPAMLTPTAQVPPASSEELPKFLSDWMTLPIDRAPRPQLLTNGDAIIPAVLRDIDHAQRSIELMAYIWKDGRLSDEFIAHLVKRQRAGVQVRILLDAYGGLHAPESKLQELENAGGKVATFHSLIPAPWTFMRTTKRNHRRAIVIDNSVAYTGGLGIDDVWLGNAQPPQWHDLMFRVEGSMAARLQGSFAELWTAITGELLVPPKTNQIAETGVPYVILSASPSPDLYPDETFLILSLLGARNSIKIETPYFLPDATIRKILVDKARSGVDVSVLLPNEKTDEKSVRWAGQRIYEELLRGGVKIYEYQPTFTHTKLLLEDGIWSVIGSANMDIRSRRLNDEVVLGVQDKQLAAQLESTYGQDLRKAKRITLDEWTKRGPVQRILELVSQAFVQQY